jgi:ubiquitin-activating enzyme E1-like protein 2
MAAVVGGFAAQEVLKGLTGKFTPLNQFVRCCSFCPKPVCSSFTHSWYPCPQMCFDAAEVCPPLDTPRAEFLPLGNRGDGQRAVLGAAVSATLADLRLFMIGCGAIGCEMIKNYALLGVATGEHGLLTVTDNDLIEKSNLNRQFLFRPQHIQQPKSTTAARAALAINPVSVLWSLGLILVVWWWWFFFWFFF